MPLSRGQAGENILPPAWIGHHTCMARYNYCFTYNNYTADGETFLKAWLTDNCKYAVYGHEVAPTTGTPHLQGYLSLIKKKTTKALTKVLQDGGASLALLYAKGTAQENRVYCTKDKDFWECGQINITGHKPRPSDDVYREAFNAPTVAEALAIIREKRPRDYALHSDAIERTIRKIRPSVHIHLYDISMFKAPPLEFNKKAILLWGATNTGKTQYALANFKNPLLVRHLDKLSEFNKELHDGIVFDDIELKNRPPTSIIYLLDWDCESDIHIRYKVATIPAQTKKIFTSNLQNPFYIDAEIDDGVRDAIERRLEKHEINQPLF